MTAFVKAVFYLYFSTVLSEQWFSKDGSHATTPYEVIKYHVETLNTRGIESDSYSVLSIDEKYNHLLVGGRRSAFLVNLDNIDSYVSWNMTKSSSSISCDRNKDTPCDNFFKIMLPFEERILLCWTGQPSTEGCSWRNRTNLSDAPGKDSQGNVFKTDEEYDVPSLSPDQNDTAVITEHGTLFTGTFQPFRLKSMIYSKGFKQPKLNEVYTSLKGKSSFFADVQFVKSFEIGNYVYFFFRERTLECSSCGKLKISRVARICKGDLGGRYSLENVFLTFQKVKLSCSDGKDYPVNFNEIQDVWWDKHTNLFHAIFTSQPNALPSSAICIYSLSSINRVFDESPFKSFKDQDEHWSKIENKHREYFQDCKVNPEYISSSNRETVPDGMMATRKMTFGAFRQLMHDPLMADAVEPTSSQAWFIKDGIRMTAIALDRVGANTLVYTSTDRGSVLKISQSSGNGHPCLLTEMDVFPADRKEVIKKMVIDINRHVLYLGSSTTLTKLSLEQCDGYDRSSCISAADPYCGWDDQTLSCVSVLPHGTPSELKQDLSTCPRTKEVGWSPWETCVQSDGNLCRCQVRPCSDKQNSSCKGGLEFRLENCTVDINVGWEGKEAWERLGVQHGGWSVWGNWSECSVEAWVVVRNRSRTCTDPVPKRGGRPCVGDTVQYEPCTLAFEEKETSLWTNPTRVLNLTVNTAVKFNVTCRARGYKVDTSIEVSNKTIDCKKEPHLCGVREGEWDSWSDWSLCSVEGFQIRRRKCKVQPCTGERLQERNCQPTSGNCEGGVDDSWGEWSECVCNHGLELPEESGVKYRVPKCRSVCPDVSSCPDTVEFGSCDCKAVGVLGRQHGSNSSDNSNFGIGHVIGAAVIGCVFAIVLCVAAIYYVHRRKKQFNVSKAEEGSLHDISSENKYSTIPRENGELIKEPLSPTSKGNRDKNRNSRIKTPSPLKIIFTRRKQHYPMDSV